MSIHIFAFGSIVDDENGAAVDVEDVEWLECAILRPTETNIVEVLKGRLFSAQLAIFIQKQSTAEITVLCTLWTSVTLLTQAIRNGDMIALWAKGHAKPKA